MQVSDETLRYPTNPRDEKNRFMLPRIAGLIAIVWATVLLLSSVALLVPLTRMKTYEVPVPLVSILAVAGLLLLVGGIATRLGNRLAMSATVLIGLVLTVLAITQLSKNMPIAILGIVLGPCIVVLLVVHLFRMSGAEAHQGFRQR